MCSPGPSVSTRPPSTTPRSCARRRAGDPLTVEVVDVAARHVASVAVSVANFVDVDLIVLGGHGIEHVEDRFVAAVAAALATRPLSRHIRVVDVAASPWARTPP